MLEDLPALARRVPVGLSVGLLVSRGNEGRYNHVIDLLEPAPDKPALYRLVPGSGPVDRRTGGGCRRRRPPAGSRRWRAKSSWMWKRETPPP